MKIIKEGNINNTYRKTCVYCQCIFEYDNNDIQIDYSLTYPNSFVMCPCCHRQNHIYNNYEWMWERYISPSPYGGPIVTLSNSEEVE